MGNSLSRNNIKLLLQKRVDEFGQLDMNGNDRRELLGWLDVNFHDVPYKLRRTLERNDVIIIGTRIVYHYNSVSFILNFWDMKRAVEMDQQQIQYKYNSSNEGYFSVYNPLKLE
jgi:hypothetical protein